MNASPGQIKAFESFVQRDQRRVVHEWGQWDGSLEHGEVINDAQCARLMAERQRLGIPQ